MEKSVIEKYEVLQFVVTLAEVLLKYKQAACAKQIGF